MRVATIAIRTKIYSADRLYDYIVPPSLAQAQAGCRVLVPFGKGDRMTEGFILACEEQMQPQQQLKAVHALIDAEPALTPELCRVVQFVRERTFCTYYDAICAVLPTGFRIRMTESYLPTGELKDERERVLAEKIALFGKADLETVLAGLTAEEQSLFRRMLHEGKLLRKAQPQKQISDATARFARLSATAEEVARYLAGHEKILRKHEKVMDILLPGDPVPVTELCYLAGVTVSVVHTLEKRGLLETYEQEVLRSPFARREASEEGRAPLQYTPSQQRAIDGLAALLAKDEAAAALLLGVTGSGKTLVYIALCDIALRAGKGVILLVPEIALTPQLTDRFYRRYGTEVAVLHSALSTGERYDEWKRIRRGEAHIVIGTRSAVFAPVQNLSMILMDEEQEGTYKSEMAPRYHARDVAKFRMKEHRGLLLLGSATPDIGSYLAAERGKYRLFELGKRFNQRALPAIEISDLREDLEHGRGGVIGARLEMALRETLEKGEQAILFLNRRGYNTHVGCPKCGYISQCPNCSVSLTYHSANHLLMCHYCGHTEEVPERCPSCGRGRLQHFGFGTQKAEEELRQLLPEARILRMDTDTTTYKNAHEKYLYAFQAGEYDIMLGTQMVAKGLDIERVTLVGVLFADAMLYLDDYRAGERAYAMLTQVTGRAGRGERPGRALIQTYTPESRILKSVLTKDYKSFITEELNFRRAMLFPPYCDIYALTFTSEEEERAMQAVQETARYLALRIRKEKLENILLFPPAPAPIARIGGKYRTRLLIKCRDTARLRQLFSEELAAFFRARKFQKVTQIIDRNPVSML